MILDSETKAVELPEHHGDELRLWLRLLTCTTLIEGEVRSRLRERFDVTAEEADHTPERLSFKLAAIHSEQDKGYLKRKLAEGRIKPLAITSLKRAGVSDTVLLKMVRSRREFDAPAKEQTLTEAAPQEIAPHVVIIGATKEPDARSDVRAPEQRAYDGPYYYVPFPLWGRTIPRDPNTPAAPFMSPEHRGFGRFINDGWIGRR